ncbi:AN1-type zinc finger protein 4 isoform X1 [Latimeria chalumnae]|uniref:AN1-type zinc finger protein 4 isoform X1 n=3 Tax=Latimeria chalumnae TaxID=7897 RepID=UPI0003C166CC|nr:PREDICTED: AN1-type zinc finger protein 4 isoform X1 [Latimeria chalumnae]XP_006006968.1 PREDICTED: AN1-type zinc finger protein 4 isoform X1 [Latimeria chalumnae]|eukprot:XP_006006967.1 PREDICTED: AN1-type zinc finger protein 4 isoform X1 [Latimeria chalumnae]
MANKKEPPFFNDENLGPFQNKLPFYETMELFIETLTGTCFELRVSPFETIVSVKAKVQRLEGIPVAQQHLIWNNMELEDEYCLNDYNISEGCTLKLVLAMRGGPINTRRVPMEDPVWEMAENMDPSRDEIWEKVPSNKQVTFLVYREGDQLNFFRVVDRGDGTLTPLSESLSGGSVYNLYAEEEEETEASPSGQQIIENSITMNKMKLLKAKMENMNLSKKPKTMTKVKPQPPMAPRPSSGSVTATRHRLFRVLPHIGQPLSSTPFLPPAGDQLASESSYNAVSALTTSLAPVSSLMPTTTTGFLIKDEETWASMAFSPSMSNIKTPSKASPVELGSPKLPKKALLPPLISQIKEVQDISESATLQSPKVTLMEERFPSTEPSVSEAKNATQEDENLPFLLVEANKAVDSSRLDVCDQVNSEHGQSEEGNKLVELVATKQPCRPVMPKKWTSETTETGISNLNQLSPKRDLLWAPSSYSPQLAPGPSIKSQRSPKALEIGSLRSEASQNIFQSLELNSLPDTGLPRTRFRGVKVDSPGKRPDIISKTEARDMTKMANKAVKEPLGSVNNLGLLASLARSTSRDSLQSNCGMNRLRTAGVALPTNLQHFQEEIFRKVSPPDGVVKSFVSSQGLVMNGSNVHTGKKTGTPTRLLPPVKPLIQTKNKNTKHCFLCGKKTGLATSYECRCGNNFCATHRYAETHDCTYDYKTAGRRYLQETNPVVSAPKLPKI